MAHVLEHERPFSQSLLWQLQRRYFDRAGPRAWSAGEVPSYVTSNPALARATAELVLGFLRGTAIDPAAPLYIVELGAGSGRFAYHVVRALERLLDGAALPAIAWRYVLTDFTDSNVEHWRHHPALRALADRGRVDFARFDAVTDHQLVLRESGETLTAGGLRNPVIVIANYVFDGLPIDLFAVQPTGLAACLATITLPEPPADLAEHADLADLADPALLTQIRLDFTRRPIDGAAYGEPELDAIVDEYRARLADTVVALPSAALRCVARLAALADQRLLLVSADKGYHDDAALAGRHEPSIAVHGSFSLAVNYHAIGRWFAHRGGRTLVRAAPALALELCAFVLDGGAPHRELGLAFARAIGGGAVADIYTVRRALDGAADPSAIEPSAAAPSAIEPSIETLLALTRLTGHDATVFVRGLPALKRQLAGAPPPVRHEVREVAHAVWDEHFAIGDELDLAFELGVLFAELEDWAAAAVYYERSLALCGPDANCMFNLGLSLFHLQRPRDALAWFERALERTPDFEPARTMRDHALAALAGATA